jgi:hypothetical protein
VPFEFVCNSTGYFQAKGEVGEVRAFLCRAPLKQSSRLNSICLAGVYAVYFPADSRLLRPSALRLICISMIRHA